MHAQIGELIAGAMAKVGRAGVVTMEESRTAEDHLYVVEGMQFERGYISPYFVTDPERMVSFRCLPKIFRNQLAGGPPVRGGGRAIRAPLHFLLLFDPERMMGPPGLVLRPACAFSWQFSFPSTTEASRGKQGLQSATEFSDAWTLAASPGI